VTVTTSLMTSLRAALESLQRIPTCDDRVQTGGYVSIAWKIIGSVVCARWDRARIFGMVVAQNVGVKTAATFTPVSD
jgi:hypothetical protein